MLFPTSIGTHPKSLWHAQTYALTLWAGFIHQIYEFHSYELHPTAHKHPEYQKLCPRCNSSLSGVFFLITANLSSLFLYKPGRKIRFATSLGEGTVNKSPLSSLKLDFSFLYPDLIPANHSLFQRHLPAITSSHTGKTPGGLRDKPTQIRTLWSIPLFLPALLG